MPKCLMPKNKRKNAREISIDIDCQPDRTGIASLVTILLPCLEFPEFNPLFKSNNRSREIVQGSTNYIPPQLPKPKKRLKSATSAKRP